MVDEQAFDDDELPQEAKALLDDLQARLGQLRASAQEEQQAIRARADAQLAAINERLEGEVRQAQQAVVQALKPLQEKYLLSGKLDEALAIRAELRQLRLGVSQVLPPVNNLTQYGPRDAGKTLAFRLVGTADGPVWGTDVYTLDSKLSTAAVHAGALQVGATGVVRVTLVDTSGQSSFTGSQRNGVSTNNWGPYAMGYRFLR